MKRIVSVILICLLTLTLCAAAFAEEGQAADDGQTITTEVNEDGTTVTTVDNGNGRVFTVEELPEYGDNEIIPAPTQEAAEDPQQGTEAANSEGSVQSAQTAASAERTASVSSYVWPVVVLAVLIVAGVTAAVFAKRKKKA